MAMAEYSDDELLDEVRRLAGDERSATARLIAALAEVEARGLYRGQGCASLFVYCTRVLHLSEHAAYGRIEAARVGRRFPVVLEMLERGDVTLTTVCLLGSQLTQWNHLDVLARARHRSKREVEEIVAQLRPRPDVRATMRKLPERLDTRVVTLETSNGDEAKRTAPPAPAPPPPRIAAPAAVVAPLAPSRYKLQLTIDRATQEKLCLARDLLRHTVPSGDLPTVLSRALDALLRELQRRKSASALRPREARAAATGARRWALRVSRARGRVWRNRVHRVPPRPAVRGRRRGDGGQHRAALPRP
jgi:hypothetical protein